ncbi:hypothetical protein AURDEDRAFT_174247 [Auricularia subglabra TFB-10046 SS5]|uniref:Uncharacterized protein n=1 Tax=Auricularia subglabra (strain TFB-10046 / SS5) TaxID=717982 RepID=J0WTJ9_AURST|nr:hypothetical protein AURDEDRAFT_174247 [Auricularia subglabra TFB-10046 SS5]
MLFETLARHWGLYFTCTAHPAVDPYGSSDIEEALNNMPRTDLDGASFEITILGAAQLTPSWRSAVETNCRVVRHRLNPVILARLLVLQHFCALLDSVDISDDSARMKWLLLQLRPSAYLGTDIFTLLVIVTARLDDLEAEARIANLYSTLRSRIAFVALDESNVAILKYPHSFASHDYSCTRPLLRQLVHVLSNTFPASRLLIAGTLLDIEAVSEPIEHSSSHIRSVRVFHELGHFDSLERTSSYARHFFGHSFSDADCTVVHAWFRGRHRFLAVLVMYGLIYGTSRLTSIMDTLVYRFTGYERRAATQLLDLVNVGQAFTDETLDSPELAPFLRRAVLNYALFQQPTVINTAASALVGIGAAHYAENVETAQLFEPLIMICLARWLSRSQSCGVQGIIRQRNLDRAYPLRDAAFVAGLASCLRDVLSESAASSLRALLDFEGRPPAWAEQSARLVLPRILPRRPRFENYTHRSDVYVELASTPDDVFRWLETASRPFLVPDPAFGAALVFVIELADKRRLLVCLDPRFLRVPSSGPVLRDPRVVPLRASEFYRRDRPSRERLFEALAKFSPASNRRTSDAHISKHNILNVLCFSRLSRAGTTYDPPAASFKLDFLLSQPRPVELEMSYVLNAINDS